MINVRIIAAFQKNKEISYISHLDVQRTLQRAFRRADLPLAYTNGYNPHPKLSFATALATGFSSEAEWIDLELEAYVSPEEFISRVNSVLPSGLRFHTAFEGDDSIDTLSKILNGARYSIKLFPDAPVSSEQLQKALDSLLGEQEILVQKKTKGGIKPTNIRPEIIEAHLLESTDSILRIELAGTLTVSGGLRVETFLHALYDRIGTTGFAQVNRLSVCFMGTERLPSLESSERFFNE